MKNSLSTLMLLLLFSSAAFAQTTFENGKSAQRIAAAENLEETARREVAKANGIVDMFQLTGGKMDTHAFKVFSYYLNSAMHHRKEAARLRKTARRP